MVLNSKPSDQQYNRDPPSPRSRNPSLQKDYRPSRRSNVAENAARKRENAKRQEEEEQLLLEELSQLESRQNALMHRVKEDLFKEENVKRNMDNEARKKKKIEKRKADEKRKDWRLVLRQKISKSPVQTERRNWETLIKKDKTERMIDKG